jgi:hypothetical protein
VDDAYLQKRIRVILVTTRAAARSLGPSNGQVDDALRRGLALLDELAGDVVRDGGSDTHERLSQARRELESSLDDRAT